MNITFIIDRLKTLVNELEESEEISTKTESNFQQILKEYEEMFYNFYRSLKDNLQTKKQEELLEILDATEYPDRINCS